MSQTLYTVMSMNIGIFDSGRGGQFVGKKLRQLLPEHTYHIIDDRDHAPYGERSYADIAQLTDTAIQRLLADCPVIVIACNTATAAAIDMLRQKYPEHHFVGFEPMIKQTARLSQKRHYTLLATHATAHSERTQALIREHTPDFIVDMPSTRGWAAAIDAGNTEDIDLTSVAQSIDNGSDTIILGCTHYIALQDKLQRDYPDVTILEPTESVARHLQTVIDSLPPRLIAHRGRRSSETYQN